MEVKSSAIELVYMSSYIIDNHPKQLVDLESLELPMAMSVSLSM